MGAGLQRIGAIDELRGLALLGILYVHLHDFYNGYPPAGGPGWWNEAATWVYREVFLAKAYAVFSFLFGVSFALQLGRAETRGEDFRLRFLWRLVLLLAFGVVDTLFYGGDILMVFAVFGVILVPFWRTRAWVVAAVAGVLMVRLPLLLVGQGAGEGAWQTPWVETCMAHVTPMPNCLEAPWGAIALWNITDGLWVRLAYMMASGRLETMLAMFLWGMLAGRCGLVEGGSARAFWRRCAGGAVVVYAVLTWWSSAVEAGAWAGLVEGWRNDAAVAMFLSGWFLVSARERWNAWALPFRAAGRMSLSCYMVQNLAGTFLLFGWGAGLAPSLTAFGAALLCAGFFMLQALACRWWLKRYRFGPLEWLWRCGTYGEMQPLRIEEKSCAGHK